MKNLLIQVLKFLGVSGIGWIFDFCIYNSLKNFSDNIIINNIISSLIGMTFVFIFATKRIFKNDSKISLRYKYIIYFIYQIVLIFFISELLGKIDQFIVDNIAVVFIIKFSAALSKVIVTPITMLINFVVMKNILEKI